MWISRLWTLRYVFGLVVITSQFNHGAGSLEGELEDKTGLSVRTITFRNWASNVQTSRVLKIKPETRNHVRDIISTARQHETRVRATGSGHAFSDLFPDQSSVLMDMSNYGLGDDDRIYLTIASYYRQYATVTVNPSVSMREFLAYLSSQGVSLPNYPSVDSSTVAGVLATGSHGYSGGEASLSQHLVNVQVINGEGEFREFDIDYNGDQFDIFRSHLGLCGVIIRMTFRVDPYPLMRRIGNISLPLYNVLLNTTNVETLINNKHSFLATWQLFSSRAQYEIDDMATNGGITTDYNPEEDLLDLVVYEEVTEGTSETGRLAETLEYVETNFTLGDGYISSATEQYGFYTDIATMEDADEVNYPIHVEMAISINRNNFNGLSDALDILLDTVADYAYTHDTMPIHNVQFGFWFYNSTCLLCHSNVANSVVNSRRKGPLIFMVNFQFLESNEADFLDLLQDIYDGWASDNIRALPHFGKYVPSFMKSDVLTMMKPRIDEFRRLRLEAGLDSIDLFTNEFLDDVIFYDVDRPSGTTRSFGTTLKPHRNLLYVSVVLILGYFAVLI